jgi:hypothetical protein
MAVLHHQYEKVAYLRWEGRIPCIPYIPQLTLLKTRQIIPEVHPQFSYSPKEIIIIQGKNVLKVAREPFPYGPGQLHNKTRLRRLGLGS